MELENYLALMLNFYIVYMLNCGIVDYQAKFISNLLRKSENIL